MKSSCIRLVVFAALLTAGNVSAATFLVTTNANSGTGSFRQAVFDANNAGGANTIAFNIAGGGVQTIFIDSALTPLTSPATIDGYTQPGASSNTLAIGNNATLLIEITTTNGSQGLSSQFAGGTIRGLVINGFNQGITLGINGAGSIVEGCFIGTDSTGTNASTRVNGTGVLCQSGGSRIGGTNPWQRNIISGTTGYGIDTINGLASNNVVIGNYIGTDKTGTKAIPNSYGIVAEAPYTQIKSNVVSGNQQFGIYLVSASNVVEGCYVGTDATGTTAVPNGGPNVGGVSVDNTGNRIGGTNAASRNIISGNFGFGVNARPGTTNSILGNFIGVDVTGTNALPNTSAGVNARQTTGIIVSNNVISGNLGSGVLLVQATRCQILDNHIGTDLSDTLDLGNGGLGIDGNSGSYFHTITGNVIAYNGSGLGHAGISFNNGADSNNVTGNLIYSNAGAGVQLAQGAVADRISDNSIFDNGHLGIILGNLGVPLVNDACDPDTANNNQQNYPVLTAATSTVNSVTIAGFLDSAPSQTYTLEFFANTVCDPSGFGEGEAFIGATNLVAGSNCTNFFNFTFPVAVANALLITATATDPNGNTSEYSQCLTNVSNVATNDPPQITCPANIVTNTAVGICARSVAFVATATGTPPPTFSYKTNGLAVTSPATFPKGVTTVSATASNIAGTDQCAFTVTVNDNVKPVITCSGNITTNVAAGVSDAVVFFESPTIDENCAALAFSGCTANSGDTFPLGTTPVTCTAVDATANTNTCTFNVTVQAAAPCTITCLTDIVTNTAPGVCGATVTFNVGSSGSCPAVVATPASGSFFNKGTNSVTVTTNGVTACTFNVTVIDNEPPSLSCPGTIVTNVPAGVTNAIVNFNLTSADDNCSGGSLIIDPPSGTAFPLGTNTVVVSMSDAAGNTNGCSFKVIVLETPPEAHDLALIKMQAPKNINLKGAEPSLTKFVKVTLQNRSPHDEVITNFTGLVTLVAESLGTNCPNATVVLHPGPPNNPKTLKPKQKMTVTFDVTWNCANDPLKGAGHEDFRYLASVHHEAIDGNPDTHPEDDGCPRTALPGGTDPNPDPGKPLKDTGCAGGVDVKTDVFLKQ